MWYLHNAISEKMVDYLCQKSVWKAQSMESGVAWYFNTFDEQSLSDSCNSVAESSLFKHKFIVFRRNDISFIFNVDRQKKKKSTCKYKFWKINSFFYSIMYLYVSLCHLLNSA